ncbi:hypothetical protein K450DRAFT_261634 [Umbelopsis ramanniana AG]|uniref:Uncharacterized protein n=1 Tax=Umbelopsis ramanniana AG TaxID=1314678 RepID=A0AAD5HA69_UMBRA|nr:uncharacterized protein K450DRAFT_261634 [Umbelopsis ramanniana AG]KAI8575474.1 hypothetical protein K450DRAFT_261634 [Umbelopsis ramanniana AG]
MHRYFVTKDSPSRTMKKHCGLNWKTYKAIYSNLSSSMVNSTNSGHSFNWFESPAGSMEEMKMIRGGRL